jgi:hypothetical protein
MPKTDGRKAPRLATINMDEARHEKMKALAKKNNRTIQQEYSHVVDRYIANELQEEILANSRIEQIMNERLGKMENRLAGLVARNGMDTSMVLMGLLTLLSKTFGKKREEIYPGLRDEAAKYYKRPLRDQEK